MAVAAGADQQLGSQRRVRLRQNRRVFGATPATEDIRRTGRDHSSAALIDAGPGVDRDCSPTPGQPKEADRLLAEADADGGSGHPPGVLQRGDPCRRVGPAA